MFRYTPSGCTKRHLKRSGREGPCLRKSRGDPTYLRLVDTKHKMVDFQEKEKLAFSYKQKERTS